MMQALRQFSEQLGLFLDGFGDCHGWVPSVVRADYGTGRILPVCSLDSISRCAAAARAAKTGAWKTCGLRGFGGHPLRKSKRAMAREHRNRGDGRTRIPLRERPFGVFTQPGSTTALASAAMFWTRSKAEATGG